MASLEDVRTKNVPDGGFGWFVVAGVILINIFNPSVTSSFGLLFGDHLQQMNQEIIGAALITSLGGLSMNFSGFFIGPGIKLFGPRKVAFLGCLLTSSGLLICALSTQLWHMILGFSIIFSVGLGLLQPSSFIAINLHFSTKRSFAVGIALAGQGFGQMILPHIIRTLLQEMGYRSTVIIISGLALNGLIGASLFRPVEIHTKRLEYYAKETLLIDVNDIKQQNLEKNVNETKVINIHDESDMDESDQSSDTLFKQVVKKFVQAMDLELLKDPIFCNITIGIGLTYTITTNFTMIFPYFLQFSVGLTKSDTAYCMSLLAATDTICRLILPILSDRFKMSCRSVFLLGCIGLLLCRTVIAESIDYQILILMSAFYGSAKSATILNNNLTISEHCELEKLPGGLGLNMMFKGIFVISIGQLLGWLRDHTGSYPLCLHAQDLFVCVVIISWTSEFIYRYVKNYNAQRRNKFII